MATFALRPDSVRANPEPIADDRKRDGLSRRGIFGAIAGVPLAAAFGTIALAPARADRSAWQAAIDRHGVAWRTLEDHPVHHMHGDDPGYEAADADEAIHIRRVSAAEREIRDMPAPDYRAVIEKLELYLSDYGEDSGGLVAAAVGDLRRLAGER